MSLKLRASSVQWYHSQGGAPPGSPRKIRLKKHCHGPKKFVNFSLSQLTNKKKEEEKNSLLVTKEEKRAEKRERVGVGVGVGFIHLLNKTLRGLIRYKGCM